MALAPIGVLCLCWIALCFGACLRYRSVRKGLASTVCITYSTAMPALLLLAVRNADVTESITALSHTLLPLSLTVCFSYMSITVYHWLP